MRGDLGRLSLATFAYFLTVGLGIPTVPRYLTGPLHATPFDVGVAAAIFSVTAILARPFVAPLAARVDVRVLLAIGAGVVGLATALMAVAQSLPAVLALRAVAGLGDALFYVLGTAAVYALAPEGEHASAQSRFSAVVSAGVLLGPVAAETLRPQVGYAGIWLLGAGLCAAAVVAVARLPLPRERGPRERRTLVERRAVIPSVVIAAQTWALSAFTIFVALYADDLGLGNANAPFAIVAVVVLAFRTLGARVRPHPAGGARRGGDGVRHCRAGAAGRLPGPAHAPRRERAHRRQSGARLPRPAVARGPASRRGPPDRRGRHVHRLLRGRPRDRRGRPRRRAGQPRLRRAPTRSRPR